MKEHDPNDIRYIHIKPEKTEFDNPRIFAKKAWQFLEDNHKEKLWYIISDIPEKDPENLYLVINEYGQGMKSLTCLLKTDNEKISRAQHNFMCSLNLRGNRVVIIYNMEGLYDALKFHLSVKVPQPIYKKSTITKAKKEYQKFKNTQKMM